MVSLAISSSSPRKLGEDRLAIMDPTCLEVSQTRVNVPKEGGTLLLAGPLGANQRPHVVARAGELALATRFSMWSLSACGSVTWIEVVLMLDMPVVMGVRFRAIRLRAPRPVLPAPRVGASRGLEELLVVLIGSVAVHSRPADLPARSKACQRP